VSTYYVAVRLELNDPNRIPDLDFLNKKLADQLLLPRGTFTPILASQELSVIELSSPYGAGRGRDGWNL